MLHYFI